MKILRRLPATSLVILALVITYLVGIPIAMALRPLEKSLGLRNELLSLWVMRWGATFAGLIVLAAVSGRPGFRVWLTQLFRWRVNAGYYVFIYGSALIIFSLSLLLAFGLFPPPSATQGFAVTPAVLGSYLAEIAYITVTNGEETGWRFVLLGLLLARTRLFSASLLVGCAWVFWHLPMYIWLGGGGLTMFAPFVFIGLGLSIILAWLYKATNSLLLPVLFHGAVNATTYSFERNFPDLAEALDATGAVGEWMYAAALLPLVVAIVLMNRTMFFGQVDFPAGENWADISTTEVRVARAG